MATQQLTLEVKMTEIDEVRELIDCLIEHYDDLPIAVQNALYKLAGE